MNSSAAHLSPFAVVIVFVATFIVLPFAAAQAQSSGPVVAIPPAIANAKTVFLSNGGADGGLFPEPFSGDPNRGYITLYNQLKATSRYELVLDPSQADLVMELHLLAPSGPHEGSKPLGTADLLPFFQLVIYDAKTHFVLWTITEPIEMALLQKTHNRNFDEALSHIGADIEAISKPIPSVLYPYAPPHFYRFQR